MQRQRSVRMDQHLGITLNPLVKLLICLRCVIDVDLMTDDEARFGAAGDDQVSEVAVVGFDVALACS